LLGHLVGVRLHDLLVQPKTGAMVAIFFIQQGQINRRRRCSRRTTDAALRIGSLGKLLWTRVREEWLVMG
jgi:hypothetical protein